MSSQRKHVHKIINGLKIYLEPSFIADVSHWLFITSRCFMRMQSKGQQNTAASYTRLIPDVSLRKHDSYLVLRLMT